MGVASASLTADAAAGASSEKAWTTDGWAGGGSAALN